MLVIADSMELFNLSNKVYRFLKNEVSGDDESPDIYIGDGINNVFTECIDHFILGSSADILSNRTAAIVYYDFCECLDHIVDDVAIDGQITDIILTPTHKTLCFVIED